MSRNFEEQVVLITGAGAGIGQAAALAFAREGARMVLNSRSVASTHTTADLLRAEGAEVVEVCGDVALPGTAQAMAEAALQHFGWIDVLVNNAGVVDDAFLLMINEDSLTRSLDINIKGYFHCAQQAALKMMSKKQGVIINVSSVSSILAVDGQGVYSATKGSMTATLAKELAPRGIRVNAVAPGFIETEMLDAIPEDKKEEYLKAIPMHRLGTAKEVADVVAQLCSDAFAYVTGQVIVLDGGLSL